MQIVGNVHDRVADAWLRVRFRHAAGIYTDMTSRERLQLFQLSRSAPDYPFVEIGSYLGASSAFIAEGIKRREKPTTLFCVDTWLNDAMSEGPRDTYADFVRNMSPYGDRVTPLRGRSTEVAQTFAQPIGLLFLDGDHSYEAMNDDVTAWLTKVAPGGVVICHDVGWAEGVQRVVRESIESVTMDSARLPNLYWARVRS